jgi:hypothetical protein
MPPLAVTFALEEQLRLRQTGMHPPVGRLSDMLPKQTMGRRLLTMSDGTGRLDMGD